MWFGHWITEIITGLARPELVLELLGKKQATLHSAGEEQLVDQQLVAGYAVGVQVLCRRKAFRAYSLKKD